MWSSKPLRLLAAQVQGGFVPGIEDSRKIQLYEKDDR